MSGSSSLSVDNILRFLQLRHDGSSFADLQRGLRLRRSEQRPLAKILDKLKKRKAIVELSDGKFALPSRRRNSENQPRETAKAADSGPSHAQTSRNSLSGRLILHQDGYGFVVPDKPMPQLDRDAFIPRDAIRDAMHGDHVQIEVGRVTPGRDGH